MFKLKKLSGIISLLLMGLPCSAEETVAVTPEMASVSASRPMAGVKSVPAVKAAEPVTAAASKAEVAKPVDAVAVQSSTAAKIVPSQPPVAEASASKAPAEQVKPSTENAAKTSKAAQTPAASTAAESKGGAGNSTELLLEKARYWQRTGQSGLAVSIWQRILVSNPNHEESITGLAKFYTQTGQVELANQYVQRLRQVNPLSQALKMLVVSGIAEGSARNAGLSAGIVDARYYQFLDEGNRALEQHQYRDAAQHYARAREVAPHMPEAQAAYADALLAHGDVTDAEAAYRAVLQQFPDYPEALLGLAKIESDRGNHKEALQLLDSYDFLLPSQPAAKAVRSNIYLRMGEQAEAAGRETEAYQLYQKSEAVKPDNPWPMLAKARMHNRHERMAEVEVELSKIARLSSLDARFAMALFHSEVGEWERGMAEMDRIPAKGRTEPMAHLVHRLQVHLILKQGRQQFDKGQKLAARTRIENEQEKLGNDEDLIADFAESMGYVGQSGWACVFLEGKEPLSLNLLLVYAGQLMSSKQGDRLDDILDTIEAHPDLSRLLKKQQRDLRQIRVSRTIQRVDVLRSVGLLGDASREINAMLKLYPNDVELLQAKMRIAQARGQMDEAERLSSLAAALLEAQATPPDAETLKKPEHRGFNLAEMQPGGRIEMADLTGKPMVDGLHIEEVKVEMDPKEAQLLFYKPSVDRSSFPMTLVVGKSRLAGRIQVKGSSTRRFIKKSLSIKLDAATQGDWNGYRQISLNSMATDPSMMREWLGWDLARALGLATPKTHYVRLNINGKYAGLFMFTEWVSTHAFNRTGTAGEGELYEPDEHGNVFCGNLSQESTRTAGCYLKVSPRDGNMDTLKALSDEIARVKSADFEKFINERFDSELLINWLVLNALIQDGDTYNKNYFLYHSLSDGKWQFMPWDLDLTHGKNWDPYFTFPYNTFNDNFVYYYGPEVGSPAILKNRMLENPAILKRIKKRIRHVLGIETEGNEQTFGWFTPDRVASRINALKAQTQGDAQSDPYSPSRVKAYEAHVEALKYFVLAHYSFLKTMVVADESDWSFKYDPAAPTKPAPLSPSLSHSSWTAHQPGFEVPLIDRTSGKMVLVAKVKSLEKPATVYADSLMSQKPAALPEKYDAEQCAQRTWRVTAQTIPPNKVAADLTFEYLHENSQNVELGAKVGDPSELRLWQLNGGKWRELDAKVNTVSKTISVQSLTLPENTKLTFVACVKEPRSRDDLGVRLKSQYKSSILPVVNFEPGQETVRTQETEEVSSDPVKVELPKAEVKATEPVKAEAPKAAVAKPVEVAPVAPSQPTVKTVEPPKVEVKAAEPVKVEVPKAAVAKPVEVAPVAPSQPTVKTVEPPKVEVKAAEPVKVEVPKAAVAKPVEVAPVAQSQPTVKTVEPPKVEVKAAEPVKAEAPKAAVAKPVEVAPIAPSQPTVKAVEPPKVEVKASEPVKAEAPKVAVAKPVEVAPVAPSQPTVKAVEPPKVEVKAAEPVKVEVPKAAVAKPVEVVPVAPSQPTVKTVEPPKVEVKAAEPVKVEVPKAAVAKPVEVAPVAPSQPTVKTVEPPKVEVKAAEPVKVEVPKAAVAKPVEVAPVAPSQPTVKAVEPPKVEAPKAAVAKPVEVAPVAPSQPTVKAVELPKVEVKAAEPVKVEAPKAAVAKPVEVAPVAPSQPTVKAAEPLKVEAPKAAVAKPVEVAPVAPSQPTVKAVEPPKVGAPKIEDARPVDVAQPIAPSRPTVPGKTKSSTLEAPAVESGVPTESVPVTGSKPVH